MHCCGNVESRKGQKMMLTSNLFSFLEAIKLASSKLNEEVLFIYGAMQLDSYNIVFWCETELLCFCIT